MKPPEPGLADDRLMALAPALQRLALPLEDLAQEGQGDFPGRRLDERIQPQPADTGKRQQIAKPQGQYMTPEGLIDAECLA